MQRWLYRVRLLLGHGLSIPFHHLFNLFPEYEFGLSSVHVSRIICRHPPLAGRRAVHITDLHLDRYLPRHDHACHQIAGLRPDWIFVTGDLLNVPDGVPHLFRFLSQLRGIAPVYMTLGNHDHFSGVPPHQFVELADRYKIVLLMNQTTLVPLGTGELAIVGLDDPTTHRADVGCIPAASPDRYTVLLAHAPMVLDLLDESHSVHLTLCGHSHGGQWDIPGVRPFWLPPGCKGRLWGEYSKKGHRLYVNRGMGWTWLPIRINCTPEILVIDWVKDENDARARTDVRECVQAPRGHDCAPFDPNPPS